MGKRQRDRKIPILTPAIDLVRVIGTCQDKLWCTIVLGDNVRVVKGTFLVQLFGRAEIAYFNGAVLSKENIFGL